jgi:hypothetical protein
MRAMNGGMSVVGPQRAGAATGRYRSNRNRRLAEPRPAEGVASGTVAPAPPPFFLERPNFRQASGLRLTGLSTAIR